MYIFVKTVYYYSVHARNLTPKLIMCYRCCFMLDAMSIKKAIQYNNSTGISTDFVNLGENVEHDEVGTSVKKSSCYYYIMRRHCLPLKLVNFGSLIVELAMPGGFRVLSVDQKQVIIDWVRKGVSQSEVAELFNVSRSTIYRIARRFETTGNVENLPKSGRLNLLSARDERSLHRAIKCDQSTPLSAVTAKFNQHRNRAVSKRTVQRVLFKLDFTGMLFVNWLGFGRATKGIGELGVEENITYLILATGIELYSETNVKWRLDLTNVFLYGERSAKNGRLNVWHHLLESE